MSKKSKFRIALSIVILIVICFPPNATATEFANSKNYSVGTSPASLVVADFNGDGKPDIAAVNSGSNSVSILLEKGDGTFQAAKNFDVGNSMTSIAAGDFNGDGKPDVAVFLPGNASGPITGEVRILFGNGDGTLRAPKVTTLTVSTAAIAAGDFNSDKKTDLIVSNIDAGTGAVTLEILIANGDGTFQPAAAVPSDVQGSNFAVADFNKDGKLDLVIAASGGMQVLLGKGDGTFQPGGVATLADDFSVTTILTADVNGDGVVDLIVDSRQSSTCGETCSNTNQHVSVFLGQANGTFGSELVFYDGKAHSGLGVSSSNLIGDILVGDFNGDGKADVADQAAQPEIRLGKGDGTFASPIPVGGTPASGVAQDLNGDKLDDLVFLDSANNAIIVLLNESPASGADLGIIAAASGKPSTVGVGKDLIYSVDVLNEGPQGATNVIFSDTLPKNVTFVSASSSLGICMQSGGVVTCDIGSLAFAADAQILVDVIPTVPETATNTMSVSATERDFALENNSATQTNTVLPVFNLTVTKSGNGSGTVRAGGIIAAILCGATCSATFASGTTVHLIEAADSGSSFQGWGGGCSGNSDCSVTMTSDMTITAAFVLNPMLTVKFAGGGAGSVQASDGSLNCTNTASTCTAAYSTGSQVSLSAIATGGSTFTGWSGACTGANPPQCSITMNADESVTATFTLPPDFKLSPASSSLMIQRGQQATDVLSITEQGGLSSAIQLTCNITGPAPLPVCSLSPSSIPVGANSPSSTLTIGASALSALISERPNGTASLYAVLLPFGLLASALAAGLDKRRRKLCPCLLLLLAGAILSASCGGGGGSTKSQAQVYTVTVTGATGVLEHSIVISVTVQ